mmetsp:Transcript_30896/g.62336  ORF Transcript_30896/g.62336 Transcript_30896/m.62336 type:complete len:95 (+) Transcript_30896:130-414(+)
MSSADLAEKAAELEARAAAKKRAEAAAFEAKVVAAGFASQAEFEEAKRADPSKVSGILTEHEAVACGICSGIAGGYDCPTDQWGCCTGCREHDV